jgi:hypothetical protein
MTSDRKIASNRRNGRRSRGPRTAAGKAVVARNALRHGLSISNLKHPVMCAEIEALARAIAGDAAGKPRLAQARIVAQAQLDLGRVQDAKVALLNTQIAVATSPDEFIGENDVPSKAHEDDPGLQDDGRSIQPLQKLAVAPTLDVLHRLARLERYERRAMSHCIRAMRAFLTLPLIVSTP